MFESARDCGSSEELREVNIFDRAAIFRQSEMGSPTVRLTKRWWHSVCLVVFGGLSAHGGLCETTEPGLKHFYSSGWGIDSANRRYQGPGRTSISADNIDRLELKWVYQLAQMTPRSYPLVSEDTIFFGDSGRGLVALDRETGCTRWTSPVEGVEISTAISPARMPDGRDVLIFGVRQSGVFALDATNGAHIWHYSFTEDHPIPMYSGSPLVDGNNVFVPISSTEMGLTMLPWYGCCTTSGAMGALDLSTGAKKWYTPTISDPPKKTGRHWLFVERYGPSGAPVWGAPTLDSKRGVVYFGTGQNYSHPTSATSDSIFAVDTSDGMVRWVMQATANDAYSMGCGIPGHPLCPDPVGPDHDFGAPPILSTLRDGRELLFAGQKSGDVHALDPETGAHVWRKRIGRGGLLGGVHFGMAVHPELELVFVPISDRETGQEKRQPAPGLHALEMASGETRWSRIIKSRGCEGCSGGISSGIIASRDLVFFGDLDGRLWALDVNTGETRWQHDSWQQYDVVNGDRAQKDDEGGRYAEGGAFDAHGPMLADDLLIVASGYGNFGQRGGNALLVFQIKSDDTP